MSKKDDLISRAEEIIRERKLMAESIATDYEEALNQNEEYISACNKKARIIVEIARRNHDKEELGDLYDQLNESEKEVQDSIVKAGIKPDNLVPQYTCKICNDTGYVKDEKCVCLKQLFNEMMMKESNTDFSKVPFIENIDTSYYDGENTKKSVELLKKLLDAFDTTDRKTTMIVGKSGVGKTFVMKSFAKSVAEKDKTVLYLTACNMNNLFLEITMADIPKKKQIINQLLDTDLLLIDDLGTEPIYKNVTIENLYMIIDERINGGKHTIFTTNLAPEEVVARYDSRIYSRLFDRNNSLHLMFDEPQDLRQRSRKK